MIDWCKTMKQTLNKYDDIFVLRSFEKHFFNLDFVFSIGELDEMYEKFENLNQRKKSLRFEIHQHLDQSSTIIEMSFNRCLQDDFTGSTCETDFFFHDSRRDVYIWSPWFFRNNEMILLVQSTKDEKQLRPVKCQINFDVISTMYIQHVWNHELNHDDLFFLIVFCFFKEQKSRYKSHLTLIWQIEEQLNFFKDLNVAPWTCLQFKCASKYDEYVWIYMNCIAFCNDENFCTFAELIDFVWN